MAYTLECDSTNKFEREFKEKIDSNLLKFNSLSVILKQYILGLFHVHHFCFTDGLQSLENLESLYISGNLLGR